MTHLWNVLQHAKKCEDFTLLQLWGHYAIGKLCWFFYCRPLLEELGLTIHRRGLTYSLEPRMRVEELCER
jgi:hypothetical protein